MFIDVMMSLLNLVRPKKPKATAPPPPPPSRPPLPGKLFAELVGLEAMRTRRADDRRRRPRLDRSGSVKVVAMIGTGTRTIAAEMRDLSAEGIALDSPDALPVGTTFQTTLPRVTGGPVVLTYVVRRSEPRPANRHFIGAELLNYIADAPSPN
jgi:hypothetical protein